MISCRTLQIIFFDGDDGLCHFPPKNEREELLTHNIPYFHHYPNQRHIYDGSGRAYSNVFPATGIERLKRQFVNRSEKKMHFDCEIITRHVIPYFTLNDKEAFLV